MKTARVMVTTECNLNCSYCCNKMTEVKSKFKLITFSEMLDIRDEYTNLCITGGEPTLCPEKVLRLINGFQGKKYLYSNGLYNPLSKIYRNFHGITIGCHFDGLQPNQVLLCINSYYDILNRFGGCVDIRFSIEDKYSHMLPNDLPKKVWVRDDCFNSVEIEDWFIC